MSKINVLYDHQTFSVQDYGGISKCFTMYAKEFSDSFLNINAHIGARFSGNHHYKEAFPGSFISIPKIPGSIRLKLFLNRLAMSFDSFKPDVIHPTFYFKKDLPMDDSIPMVNTVHDMTPELYPEKFLKGNPHSAKREYCNKSRFVVCVSKKTKEDLIKFYGIKEEKIRVVYHGIDLQEARNNYHVKQGLPKNFLLYVGKRSGYKNFTLLFEAFKCLTKTYSSLSLVCVGGGKFTESELFQFEAAGLGNRIIQVSATDLELRGMYQEAKAFIFPSLYEGFGIPILEAFAQKCPVVLSESSCFPEVAGEAAIYFDPDDLESCIKAIEKALSQGSNALTRLGYKRAKEFTWQNAARSLASIYKEASDKY